MRSFKRLQEQAYEYLKEKILSGHFDGAGIYSETKIAAELGISRTPLRDAILRLEQEGYVSIFPSKGFKVITATHEDIEELSQIRCALEGFCAYSLANEIETPRGAQTLAKLKEILEEQKNMKPEINSPEDFAESDNNFHRTIIDYMQNKQFSSSFHNYEYKMKEIKSNFFQYPGRIIAAIDEHAYITNLLENGESGEVFDMICDHAKTSTFVAHLDSSDNGSKIAP